MEHSDENLDPFDRAISEIDRVETEPARHLAIQMDADCLSAAAAAMATGQTASVTVTLTFKRKGDMLNITGNCKSKVPKPVAGTVALYADDAGYLFNHNPNRAAGPLPGINVETPPRREKPRLETAINAKKE